MYTYHENIHFKALKKTTSNYKQKLKTWLEQHHNTDATTPYYKALHTHDVHIDISKYNLNPCTDLVIIAMGGASLVSQIICNLAKPKIRTHFLNSTDPQYFEEFVTKLNLENTNILVISNSGQTPETITLTQAMIEHYKQCCNLSLKNKILCISQADSALAQIIEPYNINIIPHTHAINGRFSLFTNIANVIASILNIDIKPFFDGAQKTFKTFWAQGIQNLPAQSALNLIAIQSQIHIHCTYSQNLTPLLNWSTQIINESLSVNNQQWCAYTSICPQDQHGVFQSYLTGENNKIFTIVQVNNQHINSSLKHVHNVTQQCTIQALNKTSRALRFFTLDSLNAESFGALAAHFIIETILIGELLNLRPFEQAEISQLKNDIYNSLPSSFI